MNTNIEVAVASVLGAEHRRLDRPCQDAVAVRRVDRGLVVAVCDGCGSAAHSELGARLGAHLVVDALARRAARAAAADPRAWCEACDEVVERLAALVPALDVGEHLLFTVLATAVVDDAAAVMTIGDGLVIVDGVPRVLEAPDGAPAYLGYRLVGQHVPIELACAREGTTIVLATDGAAPLAGELPDLAGDGRIFRNPDALRRRLALASRDELEVDWDAQHVVRRAGVLVDDATVAVLRRSPRC